MQQPNQNQQLTLQQIPLFIDSIASNSSNFDISSYCKGIQSIFSQNPQFTPQILSVLQNHPYKEIPATLMSCNDEHVNGCIQLMVHWASTTTNIQILSKSLGYLGFKSKGRVIPDVYPYIDKWLPSHTRELLMPIKQLLANGALQMHFKDIFVKMDPIYYSQYGDLVLTKKNEIPLDQMSVVLQIYMKYTAQFQGKRSTLCMLLKTILHTLDKASDVKMVQQLHVFFTMKLHSLFKIYAVKEIQITDDVKSAFQSKNIELDYIVDPLVGKLYVCDDKLDFDELIIAFRIVSMGIKQTTASLIVQNQQRAPDPITVELYDWIKQSAEFLLKMSAIAHYQERFGVNFNKKDEWIAKITQNGLKRTPLDVPDTLITDWKTISVQIEQEVVETLITTFTSIPATMISTVLPQPALLFASCKFHSIRIGFIQSLLSNPTLSGPLALHFFSYFHKSLSEFTLFDSMTLKIHMRIAKLTFMTFATNPTHVLTLNHEMIEFVRNLVDHYIKTGSSLYLLLMKHLFRSIGNSPRDDNYSILEPCINDLFAVINCGLDIPQHSLLCSEILLTLPAKLSFLIPLLPNMVKPILLALNAPFTNIINVDYDESISSVAIQALKTLDTCLDHLQHENLETMLSCCLNDLVDTLKSITTCNDTDIINHDLHLLSLKILCKIMARCDSFVNDLHVSSNILLDYSTDSFSPCSLTISNSSKISASINYNMCLNPFIKQCALFNNFEINPSFAVPSALRQAILSCSLLTKSDSSIVHTLIMYGFHFGILDQSTISQLDAIDSRVISKAYITSLNAGSSIDIIKKSIHFNYICTNINISNLCYSSTRNALNLLMEYYSNSNTNDSDALLGISKQLIKCSTRYICNDLISQSTRLLEVILLKTGINKEISNFMVRHAFNRHYYIIDVYIANISRLCSRLPDFTTNVLECPFVQSLLEIPITALETSLQAAWLINIRWYITFMVIPDDTMALLLNGIQSVLFSTSNHDINKAAINCIHSISKYPKYYPLLINKPILICSINLIFSHDHSIATMAFEQLKLIRPYVLQHDNLTRPHIKEALKPQLTFQSKNASHSSSGGIARIIELFPQNMTKSDYSSTIYTVLDRVFNSTTSLSINRELGIMDASFDALYRCPLEDPKQCIFLMVQYYCTLSQRSNIQHLPILPCLDLMFTKYYVVVSDVLCEHIDNIGHVDVILYCVRYFKNTLVLNEFLSSKTIGLKEIINDFNSLKMYNYTRILYSAHILGLNSNLFTVCSLQSIGCLLKNTVKPINYLCYYSEIIHLYGSFTLEIIKKMFNKLPTTAHVLFNDDCADYYEYLINVNEYIELMLKDMVTTQNSPVPADSNLSSDSLCTAADILISNTIIKFLTSPLNRVYFDLFLIPLLDHLNNPTTQLVNTAKSVIWDTSTTDINMDVLYCWLKITQYFVIKSPLLLSKMGTSRLIIKFAFQLFKKEESLYKLKGELALTCALCLKQYDIPRQYISSIFTLMLKSFNIMECVDVLHQAMAIMMEYYNKVDIGNSATSSPGGAIANHMDTGVANSNPNIPAISNPPEYIAIISSLLKDELTPHVVVNIYKLIIQHSPMFLQHLNTVNSDGTCLYELLVNPLYKMITLVGIELRSIVVDLFVFLSDCYTSSTSIPTTGVMVNAMIRFMHAIATSTAVKRFYWLNKLNDRLNSLINTINAPLLQLNDIVVLLDATNIMPIAMVSYKLFIEYLLVITSVDVLHMNNHWTLQSHNTISSLLELVLKSDFTCYNDIHTLLQSVLKSTQHFSNEGEEAGDVLCKHVANIAIELSRNNRYMAIISIDVLLQFKKELCEGFVEFTITCYNDVITGWYSSDLYSFDQTLIITELLFKMISMLGTLRFKFVDSLTRLIRLSKSNSESTLLFKAIISKTSIMSVKEMGYLIKLFLEASNANTSANAATPEDSFSFIYYNAVFDIYNNPTYKNTELTMLLEPVFMSAFGHCNFDIKSKFINYYESHLINNSFSRMYYLIGKQSWDGVVADRASGFIIYLYFIGDYTIHLDNKQSIASDTNSILDIITAFAGTFQIMFPTLWNQFSSSQQIQLQYAFTSCLTNNPTCVNMINTLSNTSIELPPFLVNRALPVVGYGSSSSTYHLALSNALLMNKDYDLLLGLQYHKPLNKPYINIIHSLQQSDYTNAQLQIEQLNVNSLSNNESVFIRESWLECSRQLQQWDLIQEISKHEQWHDLYYISNCHLLDFNSAGQHEQMQTIINQRNALGIQDGSIISAFKLIHSYMGNTVNASVVDNVTSNLQSSIVSSINRNALSVYDCRIYLECLLFDTITSILNKIVDVNTAIEQSSVLNQQCHYFRQFIPNDHDSVDEWSEFIKLRKYSFDLINSKFSTYIPNMQSMLNSGPNGQNSLAFKGFHELAWSFNKLAKIYRVNGLSEHCVNTLNMVYSLPNIEISEAFVKLREQAKLYNADGNTTSGNGLELIKTTNTHYFTSVNKSEFLVYKGHYLCNYNRLDEANEAYMNATQTDKDYYKAWSSWANYHIRHLDLLDNAVLKNCIVCLVNALSCTTNKVLYKQAVSLTWLLTTNQFVSGLSELLNPQFIQLSHFKCNIAELFYLCNGPLNEFASKLLLKLFNLYPNTVFVHLIQQKDNALLPQFKAIHPILFQTMGMVYEKLVELGEIDAMHVDSDATHLDGAPVSIPLPPSLEHYIPFSTMRLPCDSSDGTISKFIGCTMSSNSTVSVNIKILADDGLTYVYNIVNQKVEYPIFRTSQGTFTWSNYHVNKSLQFKKRRVNMPIVNSEYLKDGIILSNIPTSIYLSDLLEGRQLSEYKDAGEFNTLVNKYQNTLRDYLMNRLVASAYYEYRRVFAYSYSMLNSMVYGLDLNVLKLNDFKLSVVNGKVFSITSIFKNKRTISSPIYMRLTPIIQEYITTIGIQGYYRQMMIIMGRGLMDKAEYLRLYLPFEDPESKSKEIDKRFGVLGKLKNDEMISTSTNPILLAELGMEYVPYF
eukprot:NODE_64_length_24072_cov_0.332541.p1 type:complete len:2975 gc:universal NODE_64_length_24072_cov_0.332541:22797-13873(-)